MTSQPPARACGCGPLEPCGGHLGAGPLDLDDEMCDRLGTLMRERAAEADTAGTGTALDREALGRIVHDVRLAHNAKRERPFGLLPWEERSEEQRELDRRIGEAVARAATAGYENAITWGTSCLSFARDLDSAYAETVRRERAEAKLAVIASRCREAASYDEAITRSGGRPVKAGPLIAAILAITGGGRSGEKGAGHG